MPRHFDRGSVRARLALAAVACAVALALSALTAPAQPPTTPEPPAKAEAAPRSVLITGANRGLGLEFARQYLRAGWTVIATARDPAAAKDLAALGDGLRIVPLDVTSAESVAALATALNGQPIDLLINNAGVGVGLDGGPHLADLKIDEFEHVLRVNAVGPVRVTQALLPNLRAGKGRTVVGITSTLGSITANRQGGFYGYRESKAALDMFVRSIAAELKDEGFTCVALFPGWVKTDMGGPDAQLTPEQSVTGMRRVLDGLKPEDSGKFLGFDGSKSPW
jgi:NAD(P)-dependent dehydrogenase (short-subunit alcohol dehydrogenase family)